MKFTYLCFYLLSAAAGLSLQVDLSAKAAILINADTGVILFEKNAYIPHFPGSTTKIGTALYVLDGKSADLSRTVTVSAEAVRRKSPKSSASYVLENDGTMMGLLKGESITLDSLLHGLLLISGNDAANAIAEAVSSSIPQFMGELNDYLRRIGCTDTRFQNPHGYQDPEHVTTAFDLALMTQKAFQIPVFREIVAKPYHTIPASNKRPETKLKQFNGLVSQGKHFYPKSIGGKTGYHSAAGWCLVSGAVHEGRTLIAVVLGCPQNANRYIDSRSLFEAAFAEKLQTRLLVPIEEIYTKPVSGAKKDLRASLTRDLSISFYPAEEQVVRAFIHWNLPNLPIAKGQKVGEIRVMDQRGILTHKEDLVAKESVLPTFFFALKERWNRLWK
jgi:D-alanyl-D-alanine carboxypeptidase (penicillin-binding protein 5/6)